MQKTFKLFLLIVLILSLLPRTTHARQMSSLPALETGGQVIAAINAYRAANGLPAYQQNSILMGTAQGQADYQASIGSVTHDGPGGTRPKDRAYAAGYGGGQVVFVSEIIYGGYTATLDTAMTWWKGSPIHNQTMLASTYNEIGAGVATDGSSTYFTAVTGYVAGGVALPQDTASDPSSGSSGSGESSSAPAPAVVIIPVVKATPMEDGSVVHIIRTGQALWTLSAIYEVPLETILELNDLPEWAWVFPGDEILIVPPQPTAAPTVPVPTATPGPTLAPAIGDAAFSGSQEASTPEAIQPEDVQPEAAVPAGSNSTRWIVILTFSILFLVVIGSLFFQNKPQRPNEDDDPVR